MDELYHCPDCRLMMRRDECDEEEEYVTSEFWGQLSSQLRTRIACYKCGGDVEETEPGDPCS